MMARSPQDDLLQPLANLDATIHSQARLMILTYLYVVESVDYVFLMRLTGMSWGNLATHLNKLAEAEYIQMEKQFVGKKPQTTLRLTALGRQAFKTYRATLLDVLQQLPE